MAERVWIGNGIYFGIGETFLELIEYLLDLLLWLLLTMRLH